MNKKSLAGLILFAVIVTASLFTGAYYLTGKSYGYNEQQITDLSEAELDTIDKADEDPADTPDKTEDKSTAELLLASDELTDTASYENTQADSEKAEDMLTEEPWLSANPNDTGSYVIGIPEETSVQPDLSVTDTANSTDGSSVKSTDNNIANSTDNRSAESTDNSTDKSTDSDKAAVAQLSVSGPELIFDSAKVDYMSYIPEPVTDSELEAALDITIPDIKIDAKAAILIDADTKEILYYKNPVCAVFPASTSKLLTSLVALSWCEEDEQVIVGDEVKMIASDSTTAGLRVGQILTIHNLLEGMLLPSGNDAAYVIAVYVGRKSLDNPDASKEEAVNEFVRLMNQQAKSLGVKNSCFKTPDGYDAIGQYTTAYDMGLIGVAAANNPAIVEVSGKKKSSVKYVSGEQVTWNNTNKLINSSYGNLYYSKAIGLKTGTTSMAGRNIVAAGRDNGRTVVCVIMDSSMEGRWTDAIKLLKYGLK